MTPLAVAMAERDMTQKELAERSGVHRTTICKMANGRSGNVPFPVVAAVAWALDVDVDELSFYVRPDKWPLGPRRREVA